MQQQQAERRQAKVKYAGPNPANLGQDILILEPWFETKYPFNIYLKTGQLGNIKMGDTVTVEKGKQTTNKKTGQLNDPKWESSFYWDLVTDDQPQRPPGPQANVRDMPPVAPQSQGAGSARTSTSAPAAGSVPQGAPAATKEAPVQENQFRTPSQNMRTDAVKFAMECMEKGISIEETLEMAELIEKYIAAGTAPQQEQEK